MSNTDPSPSTRFSSTNQPKKNGRKPSILKKYIKNNGISTEDIQNCYRYILGLSRERLQEIIKDPESSALIATVAAAVLKDMKNGKLGNIDNILRKANINPERESDSGGGMGSGHDDHVDENQFHEYNFPAADEID